MFLKFNRKLKKKKEEIEQIEKEKCTFKPQINNYKATPGNSLITKKSKITGRIDAKIYTNSQRNHKRRKIKQLMTMHMKKIKMNLLLHQQ